MNPMSQSYQDRLSAEGVENEHETDDLQGTGEVTEAGEAGDTTEQVIEEPQGPVGPDFTKPLRTVVGRHPVRVLTVGAGNPDFPVVCLVKINGVETPVAYNLMGDDPDLERRIENIPPIPPVAIGRVLRSVIDDSLIFDTRVFATEQEAKDTPIEGFEFISTYRVSLPQINQNGEQEEIEEADDSGPQEMHINGRTLKVGQEITVNRRGYGYRQATILKFRNQPDKQHAKAFVQCSDGSGPYWARNASIR
jgi:hypothetical protein